MTDGASIGDVFVDVSPRATAFWQKFQAQTQGQGSKVGQQLGAEVGKGIQDRIASGMADGIDKGARQSSAKAAKAGSDSGGAFADGFKKRVEAALKALPKAQIGAATGEAEQKIRDLRAQLAELSGKKVGVDIDAGTATAQLDRLRVELDRLATESPSVQVRVDSAAASAQLGLVQSEVNRLDGQNATINVDADTGAAVAQLGAMNAASASAGGGISALIAAGALIGPVIVPAAAAAAAAIGAIGPAAAVGGASIGVLALGLVPVIGAVKAMGDAQDQAGKSAASGASKQLQMAGAIDQVRSAQASLANTRANAADAERRADQQVEDAVRRVGDAERNLARAQQDALAAQQAVNDARAEAARTLRDLNNQVTDNGNAIRRAVLAEEDARQKLDAVKANPAATARQREEAQLAFDEAAQQLVELRQRQGDLAAEKADADRRGIDGSKQVVAAQAGVVQANEKVADAQRAVVEANRKVADAEAARASQARQSAFAIAQAQQAVIAAQRGVQSASVSAGTTGSAAMNKLQQAMEGLSPAGVAFATFLFGLKDRFTALSKVAQEGLLPGLQAGIAVLLPLLPQVTTLVGILAKTMGDLFLQGAQVMAQFLPGFLTMIGQVAPPLLQAFNTILLNIAVGFGGLIEAFAPFSVVFFQGLAALATKFAEFATGLSSNPAFQSFIAYVTAEGPKLLEILGNLAKFIGNVLVALAPFGSIVLDGLVFLTDALTKLGTTDLQVISVGLIAIGVGIGAVNIALAVMAANPIVLAIAAVVAFGVAWFELYQHVKFFHDAVNAYVGAIVGFVRFLWGVAVAAFNAIAGAIQSAWQFIQPVFQGIHLWINTFLIPVVLLLWHGVIEPAWQGISLAIKIAWTVIQIVFGLLTIAVKLLGALFLWLYDHTVGPVFDAIGQKIAFWWGYIRPILAAVGDFIVNNVAPAFQRGVEAIGRAWEGLREASRAPVAFVVNQVVNPIIRGYNDLAGAFGVNKVNEIKGFDAGGYTGAGGKYEPAGIVHRDEYVIPKDVVRRVGVPFFDWLIGRTGGSRSRMPQYPGDGSQGIALPGYADGGLVGFFKDVWGGLTDPAKFLKGPVNAALDQIPGSGTIRTLLAGMGHKLVDGLLSFLGGGGASGSNVNKTRSFVQSQVGKPYIWASAGPGGYDCSGIVSAAWNLMHGKNPYSHTFSTMNEAPYFPKPGLGGPLVAGWTNPGERGPGGNSVGHTAAVIAGLPFESTGGVGVRAGSGVTNVNSFAHVGHFDSGGPLYPGLTIARNDTGRTEWVYTADDHARAQAAMRGGTTVTVPVYGHDHSATELAKAVAGELAWQFR